MFYRHIEEGVTHPQTLSGRRNGHSSQVALTFLLHLGANGSTDLAVSFSDEKGHSFEPTTQCFDARDGILKGRRAVGRCERSEGVGEAIPDPIEIGDGCHADQDESR